MATPGYYSLKEINKMNGAVFSVGNDNLRPIVGKLLTIIPKPIATFVIDRCVVTSTWNYAPGMTLPSQLLRDKNVIVISDFALNSDDNYRDTTILMEFAHCWLKHESTIRRDKNKEDNIDNIIAQVEQETKQELGALGLVNQWLEHAI